MKLLNPKETKDALEKFKQFDPSIIEEKIENLVNHNIEMVRRANKENFQFNPYLRTYILMLMYKKYIVFGIEKAGFETEAAAKRDAIKTLREIRKDKIPEYSVKRIVMELNRLDHGMARIRSNEARRFKNFADSGDNCAG
jgi:hypothetical protein